MSDPPESKVIQFIPREDWDEKLSELAQKGNGKIPVPRTKVFNRKDVVNAFQTAFELIGGTPRLAIWANENPDDFFKLYARLLPSQASSALGETNELIVKHILPRTALDEQA